MNIVEKTSEEREEGWEVLIINNLLGTRHFAMHFLASSYQYLKKTVTIGTNQNCLAEENLFINSFPSLSLATRENTKELKELSPSSFLGSNLSEKNIVQNQ